jgi:hypothetical protein
VCRIKQFHPGQWFIPLNLFAIGSEFTEIQYSAINMAGNAAESRLCNVNDWNKSIKIKFCVWPSAMTQRCHRHRTIKVDTWVNFSNIKRISFFKGIIQPNPLVVNYSAKVLWGPSIKKLNWLKKIFWLSSITDITESTLNLNMSENSKLYAETLQGVKQQHRGKMSDEINQR